MNYDSRNDSCAFSTEPSDDEVRRRAYEIFLRRGGQHGRDKDDWSQAVKELRAERQKNGSRSITPQSPAAKSAASAGRRSSVSAADGESASKSKKR